jgi:hypothetical protein
MALYIAMAMFNIYKLMYPLAMIDLSPYNKDQFVKPLWEEGTPLYLRVYLSTRQEFDVAFLDESFNSERDTRHVELLWDERVDKTTPSFSKSFILTTSTCEDASTCQDESLKEASSWLDQAEQQAVDRGEAGVLSVVSGAGQGIESTSILLSFYLSVAKHARSIMEFLRLVSRTDVNKEEDISAQTLLRDRRTIRLADESPLWSALQHNSTLFAHVILLRAESVGEWPPSDSEETKEKIITASRSNALLVGNVRLVKWELPHHVKPPTRVLYHDLQYIISRITRQKRNEQPPWEMEYSKPEEYAAHMLARHMKEQGIGYAYWKPSISVKYLNDLIEYPVELAHLSGMPLVRLRPSNQHPTGVTVTPAIHVDEIGMTSDKYIPVNETVTSLPLRISFDRSDIEHAFSTTSATAGGISPPRWRLLSHLSQAIESQKALGFDESDIDDVRRLIADTNGTLY